MSVRDLLLELSERGITLTCGRTEDRLNARPTAALTPELVAEIRDHKAEIIAVMREDGRLEETGKIQSGRQIFELAREFFAENEGRTQRGRQDRAPPSPGGRTDVSSAGATPAPTKRGRRQK
ncbi:MAG: hypothetical protein M3Q49_06635 [Actinomycetota bacterium]|nr:hypothetical protein [Actinomycetota bacterium]MDP9485455.1 hypothetical protein [Actinomycetota bacterium]